MRPTKYVTARRAFRLGTACWLVSLSAITVALASTNMVIRSTTDRSLGARILEGPARYSLYVFCVGTQQSRCSGGTSSAFSPLIARGRLVPAAHSGIKPSRLGTRKLSSGRHQVTFYGQPLYLFKGDRKPGQTRGEERSNSKGVWLVVSNTGRPIATSSY